MKLISTTKRFYIITVSSFALFSACAGTPSPVASAKPIEDNLSSETLEIQNTEKENKTENKKEEAKKSENSNKEMYKNYIKNIELSVSSTPKTTTKGKTFSSPYSIKAANEKGEILTNFAITAYYPIEKDTDGNITKYEKATLTTNEEGIASFTPKASSISCNDKIYFIPAANEKISDDKDIDDINFIKENAISADYKVRTDYLYKGGVILILDMNKNGTSFDQNLPFGSEMQKSMRTLGFTGIGNGPDFSEQVMTGNQDAVYKAAKQWLGNASSYLIYGTVKYINPIETTADGKRTVTLEADITCINMRNNSILTHVVKQATITANSDWAVLTEARKQLADYVSEKIYFGL